VAGEEFAAAEDSPAGWPDSAAVVALAESTAMGRAAMTGSAGTEAVALEGAGGASSATVASLAGAAAAEAGSGGEAGKGGAPGGSRPGGVTSSKGAATGLTFTVVARRLVVRRAAG
jgi:hypothetical protein